MSTYAGSRVDNRINKVNCENTFKSILRADEEDRRYRQNLIIASNLKKNNIKIFDSENTDIFNNDYKRKSMDTSYLEEKYKNNWVKGHLRSNIQNMSCVSSKNLNYNQ
jgi:hypothetical protein